MNSWEDELRCDCEFQYTMEESVNFEISRGEFYHDSERKFIRRLNWSRAVLDNLQKSHLCDSFILSRLFSHLKNLNFTKFVCIATVNEYATKQSI